MRVTRVRFFVRESLIQLVDARVGVEHFSDALTCLSQHGLYAKALQKPQPSVESPDVLLFDHLFAKLFKTLEGIVTS